VSPRADFGGLLSYISAFLSTRLAGTKRSGSSYNRIAGAPAAAAAADSVVSDVLEELEAAGRRRFQNAVAVRPAHSRSTAGPSIDSGRRSTDRAVALPSEQLRVLLFCVVVDELDVVVGDLLDFVEALALGVRSFRNLVTPSGALHRRSFASRRTLRTVFAPFFASLWTWA